MKQFYPQILCITLLLAGFSPSFAGNNSKLSDKFIENAGQVKTEKGAPANDVLFYKAGTVQYFITSSGFSTMVKTTGKSAVTYNKIDFKFDNVKISKEQIVFVSAQSAPINIYGPGKNILSGIKTSKTVLIKGIYPGIDWVWTIDYKGAVTHDFMVNVGADASVIHYTVNGADIDNTGGDILKYLNKNFRLREGPVVFKTRQKEIPGNVMVKGNSISFQLNDELKKGGFTIDPPLQLEWSHGFDTVSLTSFSAITTDDSLNTYSVGYSSDYHMPTFPEVYGSYVSANPDGGTQDAVIMKTDPNQNLVWMTFFGGSGNDQANAVAAAPSGIFVVGYSESWDFPQATLGTYNAPVSLTSRDAFIVKLNSVGLLQWSTGYGGSKADEATDVKYYNGLIYVGGYTYSRNFPAFVDSISPTAYFYHDTTITRSDAFLLEFDTVADRIWSTCFGGSGDDFFSSLWVDGSGIYATGFSDSITGASMPLVSNGPAYFQNSFQNTESFVIHLDGAGVLDWSTYYGGQGNDIASCIVRTPCQLMICGKTDGDGLPVMTQNNGNYYQTNYVGGGSDGFIAGFNPTTYQQEYGTYYGSGGYDALTKFASDVDCNTIFTGFSNGQLPVTGDSTMYYLQNNINGGVGFDGIMLGLDGSQNAFWSTYFGSIGDDFGLDVAIIAMPIVDIVGTTFYNYGNDTIGGTFYTNDTITLPCPDVTSNGVSNRFNLLGFPGGLGHGNPHQGNGGGSGPDCGDPLQFQSLIPIKNACPNQCNGEAMVDINNVGGCPPIKVLWSNGDTTLIDTGLCTLYWNKITDSLGFSRELYGKFDVLRVPPVPTVTTFCGAQPDWNSIILPAGGGAPYTIDYRGVSTDTCPSRAYFNISDTAGCTISFSVPWIAANVGVTTTLKLDTNTCKMVVSSNFGANCPSFLGSQSWFYVLIEPNGDTVTFPFANYGQQVPVPISLDSLTGGTYSAYLNMVSCNSNTGSLYWVPAPQIDVHVSQYCANPAVTIINLTADPAFLQTTGGYYETVTFVENSYAEGYDGSGDTITKTFHFTPDTSQNIWELDSTYPAAVYIITGYIIQGNNAEAKCAITTIKSGAGGLVVFLDNNGSICTGGGYISVSGYNALNVGDTFPAGGFHLSYYWPSNGSTDSLLYVTHPGVYSCVVTSSFDTTCHVTVTDTIKFLYDSLALNQTPCGPGLFEKGTVFTHGGTPPYHIVWSSGETSSLANFISQGADWVTVKDAGGCKDSLNFTNTKQLPLSLTDTAHNPRCFYSQDGSIALTTSYGYPPYGIMWIGNGASGFNPTGLKAGTYKYVVTDSMGCKDSAAVVLVKPDTIVFLVANNSPAGCHSNNGSLEIDATGGTGQLNIAWSDAGSGFIRDSLVTGNYGFTISDANGCSVTGSAFVDSVLTLYCYVTPYNPLCYGTASGSASVIVLQASYPVNYTWQYPNGPGPDSPVVANLYVGTYVVTVTDNSGCSFIDTFSLTQPDSLQTTIYTTPASCTGSNGFAQSYSFGGTPGYSLIWGNSNYQSGNNVYYLTPGYYAYTVADYNGCTDTGSVIITDTNGLQPSLAALNSCLGDSSGSATVTVNDIYTSNYYYAWTYNSNLLSQQGSSITQAPVGNYSIEVTDDQGCDTTLYFTINVASTDMVVTNDTGAGLKCYGNYIYIDVSASGSFGPFNGTGQYLTYGGTQIITVTDQTGCGVFDTVTVTPPPLLSSSFVTTGANCAHGNGSLQITTTGGTLPYRVYYNGHLQYYRYRDTISLPTGNNLIDIEDSNNCFQQYNINIGFTNSLSAHVTGSNILCHGDSTGATQATIITGTQPITYHWSNGSTTQNIQNLHAGTYLVTITSAGGCTYDTTIVITQPSTAITLNIDTGPGILCFGNSDVVNVFASGGTGHFTGTGSYTFYAGTHVVTVQDSIGCHVNADINLSQPAILNATANEIPAGCTTANGGIQLYTSGGVGPYSINFNGGSYSYSDSLSLTNISPGFYSINVTDARNCSSQVSVTVHAGSNLVATASAVNPTCYGLNNGTITLTVTSGVPPFFYNGNSFNSTYTISNLGQGFYSDTITNLGGCSVIVDEAIFEPFPLSATDTLLRPVKCYGDSATVLIYGSGGTPPYTGIGTFTLAAGTYPQVITDSTGCSVNVNINVTTPDTLITSIYFYNQSTCAGQNVGITTVGGTGPYSYSWNSSNQSGTGTNGYVYLDTGSYTFSVTDANHCQDTGSFAVHPYNGWQAVLDSVNACNNNNGSASIQIIGGQSLNFFGFQWFDQFNNLLTTADSVFNLGLGQYSVVVSNSNTGCDTTIYFNITFNSNGFAVANDTAPGIQCYGAQESVTVSANGGTSPYYGIGQYLCGVGVTVVKVSDQTGCTVIDTINLSQPAPMVSNVTQTSVGCSSTTGSVLLSTTGGIPPYHLDFPNMLWYYDTLTLTDTPGTYNTYVYDSLGCAEDLFFVITHGSSLTGSVATLNPTCNGLNNGQAIITMQGGNMPYQVNGQYFDTPVIQFDSLPAGSTTYQVTDSLGCSAIFTTSISQPNALVVDTNLLMHGITCFGRNDAIISVDAFGGTPQYTYTLQSSTGSPITQNDSLFANVSVGTYTVMVSDAQGCTDSLHFTVPPFVPSRDSIVVDSVHCYDGNGGVIKIYPLPADRNPYTFSLNGGTPQVYNVFYNLTANNYQVIVSDANNCMDTLNLSVGQPDSIDSRVWLNDTLLPRDSIILNNRDYANFTKLSSNPWMVTFTPTTPYTVYTDSLVQVQPLQSLTYTVTIFMDSTDKGCFIQYTGFIDVMVLPEFPNTITPNGDGINDVWKVDLTKYPNAAVTIFDRWGEIVYTSTDYTNDWGGIDQRNGKKLPDGTYFYLMKVPSQNNAVFKGDINIVDAPR